MKKKKTKKLESEAPFPGIAGDVQNAPFLCEIDVLCWMKPLEKIAVRAATELLECPK